MARKKNQTPPPPPAPLEGLDAFAVAPPANPTTLGDVQVVVTQPTAETIAAAAELAQEGRVVVMSRLHDADLPAQVIEAPGFRPLTDAELEAAKEAEDVSKTFGRVPEASAFLRAVMLRDSVQISTRLDAAEAYLKAHGDLDEDLQEAVFGIMNHEPAEMKQRVRAAKILLGVAGSPQDRT